MLDLILQGFGSDSFIDTADFAKLVVRFLLNFTAAWLVIRGVYERMYKWNEFVFTYFAFSIVTFSLCLMLRKVPTELGFALGLFAVFGILRYRTEPVRVRDLTYLFVIIGLAILNAVANRHVSVAELVGINAVIVGSVYVFEFRNRGRRRAWKNIVYDNLELVHPSRRAELIADLEKRVGFRVISVNVVDADLLRDVAKLRVECALEDGE
ncbi:MAG: hypothetical protein ACJAYU_002950 [Bradymonadia bacterium]